MGLLIGIKELNRCEFFLSIFLADIDKDTFGSYANIN